MNNRTLNDTRITATSASTYMTCWKVHKGSYRVEPQRQVLTRKFAYECYRLARQHDRAGRCTRGSRGTIGQSAMAVLEALIHDFLNYTTGRLDPSYERLAQAANLTRSTVAIALNKLRDLGIISWIRRCSGRNTTDGWRLEQDTNSYAIELPENWVGYKRPASMQHRIEPSEIGAHPPLPDVQTMAVAHLNTGGSIETAISILKDEPADKLAAALAEFGRLVLKSESRTETGPKIER